MCPTGHRRRLRALPVIIGAYVPYRILKMPMSSIGHSKNLCALSVNVGALVPYRLIVSICNLSFWWDSSDSFWTKDKRLCTHVWGLCFSNITLTHWVFNSLFSCFLYRYRSARTLNYPTKIAHVCSMVSTVHFWHEVVAWWRIHVLSSRGILHYFFCHV